MTVRLRRELDRPVTHVALDKLPHAAALVPGAAFVHDHKGWREEPLPASLKSAASLDLGVFFGRDYRIRVVGARIESGATDSVYLRWLPGGLRPAFDEIGQLGNTRKGPLIAILGTADPELVCRAGEVCLVKRITGWAKLPAQADLRLVAIDAGRGFALAGQQVFRAERAWEPVGPPGTWQRPEALFVRGERAFVLESQRPLVHELDGGAWRAYDSPVGAPRAVWGAPGGNALWLVGAAGIAYRDAAEWRAVADAPTGLRTVLGRSAEDVWFGGESGLYRLEGGAASPPAAIHPGD